MSSAFTEIEMVSLAWRKVDQVPTILVAHARFDTAAVVVVDGTVVVVAEVAVAHALITSDASTKTPLINRHVLIRPGYDGAQ